MVDICRRNFQVHFLVRQLYSFYKKFAEFFFKCAINNEPAIVQVMAWH